VLAVVAVALAGRPRTAASPREGAA